MNKVIEHYKDMSLEELNELFPPELAESVAKYFWYQRQQAWHCKVWGLDESIIK